MSSSRSALLIGGITHSRKEWDALGSLINLKEYGSGSREDFMSKCKSGDFDDVVGLYRSNDSVSVTGPFDKELVQVLPKSLKFICHNGAGYDNIDVAACSARNLEISSTPIAVNDATADVAMLLMLGALRRITGPFIAARKGEWRGKGFGLGHDPKDKTLGILGMGGIGRAIAARAKPFGMSIQYHNRNRLPADQEQGAKYVSFEELLKTSDVLSLSLALNASTKHIISKPQFDMMKDGVVVVNTARGPIIDEAALVDALDSGKVFSAGLDVFEEEPKIHPGLLKNENAVLLPHVGTATWETQKDMELLVLDNLKSALEGKGLLTQIPEQKQKKSSSRVKLVNLDFDARVPVPFSVFPSTYRNEQQTSETTEVKTDERITVQGAGREGQRDRKSQQGPSRRDDRYTREDIRITEEDRRRPDRVRFSEDVRVREDDRYDDRRDTRIEIDQERYREPYRRYADAQIDVEDRVYDRDTQGRRVENDTRIDITERDYRERTTPFASGYRESVGWQDKSTYPREYPSDGFAERDQVTFDEKVNVTKTERDMGYYDDEGQYHSFRHGLRRAAENVLHPIHGPRHHHHHHDRVDREEDVEIDITERERDVVQMDGPRRSTERTTVRYDNRAQARNTVTIPCHFIRIGDLLILQGRPCQVIRITTSAQTGQHRYLGVDLFTKQLHEESSFISNPSPSVFVQNMLGPVFKQYRILDMRDDGRVVAMTETGDVKQAMPVLDQSNLLNRINDSFANGRGSVRALVINDEGRELVVDYKVVHGSRL